MGLKRKIGWAVLFIVAIFAGMALGAVVNQLIEYHPQEATVTEVGTATYLDGELQANNTLWSWNLVNPNTTYYYENLTVKNVGTANCTVYLTVQGLPLGWNQTWAGNATFLQPGEQTSGELTLYVAADAITGQTYTWDSWIVAEQT